MNTSDPFHAFTNWLSHNRFTAGGIALIVAILSLGACESFFQAPSPTTGKPTTKAALVAEAGAVAKKATSDQTADDKKLAVDVDRVKRDTSRALATAEAEYKARVQAIGDEATDHLANMTATYQAASDERRDAADSMAAKYTAAIAHIEDHEQLFGGILNIGSQLVQNAGFGGPIGLAATGVLGLGLGFLDRRRKDNVIAELKGTDTTKPLGAA